MSLESTQAGASLVRRSERSGSLGPMGEAIHINVEHDKLGPILRQGSYQLQLPKAGASQNFYRNPTVVTSKVGRAHNKLTALQIVLLEPQV